MFFVLDLRTYSTNKHDNNKNKTAHLRQVKSTQKVMAFSGCRVAIALSNISRAPTDPIGGLESVMHIRTGSDDD